MSDLDIEAIKASCGTSGGYVVRDVDRYLLVAMFLTFWGLGVYGLIGAWLWPPIAAFFMTFGVICVFGAMAA